MMMIEDDVTRKSWKNVGRMKKKLQGLRDELEDEGGIGRKIRMNNIGPIILLLRMWRMNWKKMCVTPSSTSVIRG